MIEEYECPVVETMNVDGAAPLLIACDHAGNKIPESLFGLGMSAAHLQQHIAYDIGALAVAELISDALHCPLVAAQFSRLLIDPNRGLDDPTLVMKLSDGDIIPANRRVDRFADNAAWQARIDDYYKPYNAAIEAALAQAKAQKIAPIILSVHSFTPQWRGAARPWHAAVLWDKDDRLKQVMTDYMAAQPEVVFGDNEPYTGRLKNDCLYRHGTQNGLPHALIELRQNEIDTPRGQAVWAQHMVAILKTAIDRPGLAEKCFFGSVHDRRDVVKES